MHSALSEITVGYIKKTAITHVKNLKKSLCCSWTTYNFRSDESKRNGQADRRSQYEIAEHTELVAGNADSGGGIAEQIELLGQVTKKKCYES